MADIINTVSGLDTFLDNPTQANTEAGGDPNLDPITEPVVEAPTGEPEPEPEAEPTPTAAPVDNKANAAFAAMRAQNAKFEKTIKNLAAAMNISATGTDELLSELETMAAKKLAGDIPVEFFMQHQSMQEQIATINQERHTHKVMSDFADLTKTYGLTDKEVYDFALALDQQGLKPFEDPNVDVHAHYYRMNAQTIMDKRVKAAVEQALRKDAAANTHASTPSATKGKGTTETSTVNTVRELDAWMNSQTK